jgi:hypothetical protein
MSDTSNQITSDRSRGRRFTPEEDAVIIKAAQSDPSESWPDVVRRLGRYTVRQCRERWLYYLLPETRSEPWTPEEDQLLVDKINEIGRSWKAIVPYFNQRSAANIKNRWHGHLKSKTVKDGTKLILTENCPVRRGTKKPSLTNEEVPGSTNAEAQLEGLWEEATDQSL